MIRIPAMEDQRYVEILDAVKDLHGAMMQGFTTLESRLGKRIDGLAARLTSVDGRVRGLERWSVSFEAKVNDRFEVIDRRFEAVDVRFEAIDRRFEAVDVRFEAIDRRFEAIDRRFDAVDVRFDVIDRRFEAVDVRFDTMDGRFDRLEERLIFVEQR